MSTPHEPQEGNEIVERFRAPAMIRKELTELVVGAGGLVWTRGGLEPKHRSLATIAVLTALGRKGPLREHVGLGLDNGLEPREICEGIIQCAIYAGFPSCIEAMEIAAEVFEERGVEA